MIGAVARKFLNQCSQPAVDMGKSVTATYVLCPWEHVNQLRIEMMVERLINELVQLSSAPGAGPASALGLVSAVEHSDGRIVVTFGLSNDGKDVGCL